MAHTARARGLHVVVTDELNVVATASVAGAELAADGVQLGELGAHELLVRLPLRRDALHRKRVQLGKRDLRGR